MTFGTEQKRHLLRRYRNKGVWQNSFPTGVNVYIYSGENYPEHEQEFFLTRPLQKRHAQGQAEEGIGEDCPGVR